MRSFFQISDADCSLEVASIVFTLSSSTDKCDYKAASSLLSSRGVTIGFSLAKGNLGCAVMLSESTFRSTAFKSASAEKLDSVNHTW